MALDNFRKINITLNKANQHILEPQITKVGDVNGRELVVQLIDGGVIKDQTGVTLKLNWQHANGNQGSETFNALDASKGVFSVYYPENMLFRGTVTANISINESGKITNSLNFQIAVKGDVFDGSAIEVDGVLFTLKDLKDQLDERDDDLGVLEGRQNEVENQFDLLQQEITDKDPISAPEIIAARGDKATLGQRLDATDAHLVQTDSKMKYRPNAESPLDIPTYVSDPTNQTTHPKVLFFDNHWNGYKYWMAHTPYPNANDEYENPSIVVSNDGINWFEPTGITNPIDHPEDTVVSYMSDNDLLMRGNTMEIWYREAVRGGGETIYRQVSTNGVSWSGKEVVYETNAEGQLLSPSTLYEDGKYKMWYVSNFNVYYTESTNATDWSEPSEVTVSYEGVDVGYRAWHLEVIKTGGKYSLILNAGRVSGLAKRDLFYGQSENGFEFIVRPIMFTHPDGSEAWDNGYLYKSSLVIVNGLYKLYYGAKTSNNKWYVGLSTGDDMYALKGTKGTKLSTSPNGVTYVSNKELKLTDFGVSGVRLRTSDDADTVEVISDSGQNFGHLKTSDLYISLLKSLQVGNEIPVDGKLMVRNSDSTDGGLFLLRGTSTKNSIVLKNIGIGAGSSPTLEVIDHLARTSFLKAKGYYFEPSTSVPEVAGAIRFNPDVNKHQGFDGTVWHDMY